ncbi:helix-turn-helix domain-containing protein [Clostridium botulinum]|uniref:helix-turn-helix domain-containing protein n=1 Tax=Clostridium botulinum TaxID=1491 RepID=UPI0009474408|nr:helix-turn-helix domain-containing protein [Clostridium botulinum]APQ75912.1 helix-turn-helix family protein [Clostridium botulinum]MBN3354059.1 immunity protein [Clostridium botulinum]QDY29459.1 helix-turn-helix domain-containing protein [Clostridium botulinum]
MLKKMINESFGEYITRLRQLKGYSQRKLALITGISNTTISRIEKNITTNPDLNTLKLLAQHLNIDEIYMLEAAGYKDDSNHNEQLTKKDEKEIEKILNETKERLGNAEGLMLNGELATPEAIQSILDAMKVGMEIAKERNKKYTPNKYKKNK